MRVSRLEIFGFKSFMEKLSLPLQSGITAVVGPNGCGKSNVVDALRWVLGETNARNLRGGTLSDVIFNGTEKLRPLGLAEVTITIESSEKNFFADLVAPSLEAGALEEEARALAEATENAVTENTESEINLEKIENSEVEVQLAEAPIEPRLRVVENEPDSGKPAESQTDSATNQNTISDRFSWLKSVQEVQVTRRYYRSGESEYFINRVPCRLKDMVELFQALGLGARTYTIVAQEQISRIITAKPNDRREILEEAAGVLGFRDRIASAGTRLKETEANLLRLDDVIKEVQRNVNSLKRQANRARNREQLKQGIFGLEKEIYSDSFYRVEERWGRVNSEHVSIQDKVGVAEAALQKCVAEEEESRGQLMQADIETDQIRNQVDSIKEELRNRESKREKLTYELREASGRIESSQKEAGQLNERKTVLFERIKDAEKLLVELLEVERQVAAELENLGPNNSINIDSVNQQLKELRLALSTKDSEIGKLREKIASHTSVISSLKDQLKPAVVHHKTIEEKFPEVAKNQLVGLFIDGITVPTEYQKAVQAIVSNFDRFVVAKDLEEVIRAYAQSSKDFGLGVLKAGISGRGHLHFPTQHAVEVLLDVIVVDKEEYSLATNRIFQNVFVADSLDDALGFLVEYHGRLPEDFRLVTRAGQIITEHSFYFSVQDSGFIEIKGKIYELERNLEALKVSESEAQDVRRDISKKIVEAEVLQQEALRKAREYSDRSRELSSRQGNALGKIETQKRMIQQTEGDIEKANQQIEIISQNVQRYQGRAAELNEQVALLKSSDEDQLRVELTALNEKMAAAEQVRSDGRKRLGALAQASNVARSQLDGVRSKISLMALDLQKLDMEKRDLEEKILGLLGQEGLEQVLHGQRVLLQDDVRFAKKEELTALKDRLLREGDVDPDSIRQFEEESARLEDLEAQHRDLHAAALTLKRTIEKLTQASERRFVSVFEQVNQHFEKLVPKLFGGGSGRIEMQDPTKPLESGVEVIIRPPGKKLKGIELLSGGEKALSATALIISMFLVRPSPLCVLDEVDAPLDEANLQRYLALIKEMSDRIQVIMITHNKNSMAMADNLVGVTMQEPGASKVIAVSLQEAYKQVA